jgi:thiamine transport system substrate-binding protein
MGAMEWWGAMADNDAIFTTGWSEAYEIHYSGGYGVWEDGFIGDAWLTVSYCHSPGVEAFFGGNSTISKAVDIDYASFHQVEYAAKVNGGGSASAVDAFIEFLLSNEINTNMPENNYMYSVLEGENLPETGGYRHHSPIPSSPSEITTERIDEEMENWLMNWREATQSL